MSDIVSSDLRFYKPEEISRDATNGGTPTFNAFASAVLGNVFPLVTSQERLDGLKDCVKIFIGAASANAASIYLAKFLLHNCVDQTSHRVLLSPAVDHFDDQDDFLDGSLDPDTGAGYDLYGTGTLNTTVSASGTTIIVDLFDNDEKSGGGVLWRDGDKIFITDKASWDSGIGNYEELTIATSGVSPHATLPQVTLTVTTGLVNGYAAGTSTYVGSIPELGTIAAILTSCTATTVGDGDYTSSGISLYNNGTPTDTITLTFTSATEFTAAGADLGALASGSTASDYEPLHPDTSQKMFTLPSSGWTGTWASGDTLVLVLKQCCKGVWAWREVPAASAALSSISLQMVQRSESN